MDAGAGAVRGGTNAHRAGAGNAGVFEGGRAVFAAEHTPKGVD
jgi:hypothetical protein